MQWSRYMRSRDENLMVMMITGTVIAVIADVIAEVGIYGRNYNAKRFFAFCLWGVVLTNILHEYLAYLSKQSFNKNRLIDSALKAMFNEALIAPLIVGLFIVFSTTILSGERDPAAITKKLSVGLVPTWKDSVVYWLISDTLMLSLLKTARKQVVFNMASVIVYQTLTALMAVEDRPLLPLPTLPSPRSVWAFLLRLRRCTQQCVAATGE